MSISVTLGAATLLAAASAPTVSSVAMFEQVPIGQGPAIYPAGILQDTRCPDQELCFRDERLIVATVLIDDQNFRRGVAMELGVPIEVPGGLLTLVGTSARPREYGAIPLSEYRLTYLFEPIG